MQLTVTQPCLYMTMVCLLTDPCEITTAGPHRSFCIWKNVNLGLSHQEAGRHQVSSHPPPLSGPLLFACPDILGY